MNKKITLLKARLIAHVVKRHYNSGAYIVWHLAQSELQAIKSPHQYYANQGVYGNLKVSCSMRLPREFKYYSPDIFEKVSKELDISDPAWSVQQLVKQLSTTLGCDFYHADSEHYPVAQFSWF